MFSFHPPSGRPLKAASASGPIRNGVSDPEQNRVKRTADNVQGLSDKKENLK